MAGFSSIYFNRNEKISCKTLRSSDNHAYAFRHRRFVTQKVVETLSNKAERK
jgi:hypothetical protein